MPIGIAKSPPLAHAMIVLEKTFKSNFSLVLVFFENSLYVFFFFSSKTNINATATPLLVLQTDIDGLYKLKESKAKKRLEKLNERLNNRESNKSDISFTTMGDDVNTDALSNVSFDACEISELQITSV